MVVCVLYKGNEKKITNCFQVSVVTVVFVLHEQGMKNSLRRHYLLKRANRILHDKVIEIDAKVTEETIKKFGRLIDIRQMQLISVNPKAELLR
jgi:hypothetical protein